MNNPNFPDLSRVLLRWFTQNARDLPWRNTFDPYAIWVSEIMLQQTQVKTVVPYWERWMLRFPNLKSLAEASEPEILKAWEGLGYYSRPRNLQRAARMILLQHGGIFPQTHLEVLSLPGIGPYTAGAICSIAFNQPTPILDGNVARVLARLFVIDGDIKSGRVRERLWADSKKFVEAVSSLNTAKLRACSSLNQGLMELGALICTPTNPGCPECPLNQSCLAFKQKRTSDFPEKSKAKLFRRPLHFAFILRRGNSVLLRKRRRGEVNSGFWEFPNIEIARMKKHQEQLRSFLGFDPPEAKPWHTIRHTITTNRITLRAFYFQVDQIELRLASEANCGWKKISALEKLPFTGSHSKLRERLTAEDAQV